MEEVGARVSLKNARKAQKDAKDTAAAIDDIGDEARQAGRSLGRMNSASRALGSGVRSLGVGSIYAAAGGAALGLAFGVRTYKAFDESRRIAAQTAAVIKSTGGAAGVTAKDVGDLAGSLSEKTGVDDELIQSGANLLLTFKQIRNETGKGNDVFDQATEAAMDLSAAGFGSMESTSKQLGKALNDPLKGITALNKSGVTFTEEQKKRIKNYVKEGNLLEAQKLILREVNSQVGGSAEEQGSNLDKLQVQWGNIEEAVGKGVYPAVDAVSAELLGLSKDILPDVEAAASRVAGIFGSDKLSLEEKLRFSGRAISEELGPALDPIIAGLEQQLGQVDVGGAFADAIRVGAPVAADALAAQAPRMAGAFVEAFRNAGPGGQLLTVGLLLAKFGAFRGAGAAAAGLFTSSFRTAATSSGVFGQVGRSGGSKVGDGVVLHTGDRIKNGAKNGKFDGAGEALGGALAAASLAQVAMVLDSGLDDLFDYIKSEGPGIFKPGATVADWMKDQPSLGTIPNPFYQPGENYRGGAKGLARDLQGGPKQKVIEPFESPIGQRRGGVGRGADTTSRGASFALPGVAGSGAPGETVTFEGPIVLQMPDGEVLSRQTVKVMARRQARR